MLDYELIIIFRMTGDAKGKWAANASKAAHFSI
jgi:hypothetical protein